MAKILNRPLQENCLLFWLASEKIFCPQLYTCQREEQNIRSRILGCKILSRVDQNIGLAKYWGGGLVKRNIGWPGWRLDQPAGGFGQIDYGNCLDENSSTLCQPSAQIIFNIFIWRIQCTVEKQPVVTCGRRRLDSRPLGTWWWDWWDLPTIVWSWWVPTTVVETTQ